MSLYPFLRSPFTEIGASMFNAQQNPNSFCAKIEMKLYDCLEAYGIDQGRTKCIDYMEDMKECSFRYKEDARVLRMKYERHRQYYSNERDTHYEPPPKMHSW